MSVSLGNSAVQVRSLLLRPTRLWHRPPGQILQVASLLNLADNPLSSAQCRQFIAQPRKPIDQGSFIDEAQRGLGNKSGLGCAHAQTAARTLDGIGVELALENPTGYNNLWHRVSQRVHHRVLPAMVDHDAGTREELGKV